MKIKIFKGSAPIVEEKVNAFLEANPQLEMKNCKVQVATRNTEKSDVLVLLKFPD
jgi:galactitol-specific phosphotransferase system IIB component